MRTYARGVINKFYLFTLRMALLTQHHNCVFQVWSLALGNDKSMPDDIVHITNSLSSPWSDFNQTQGYGMLDSKHLPDSKHPN